MKVGDRGDYGAYKNIRISQIKDNIVIIRDQYKNLIEIYREYFVKYFKPR